MPISFLVPAFLAGLALLAAPVILHLVNRPKDRVVEFPSLMFLDAQTYRSATRRRLRDRLLLALRCLALVALVAAFARPVFDRPTAAAAGLDGGREVVILVDRSYSMAYGERRARAVEATRAAVDALRGGDRATIVFFDDGAGAATRATRERDVLFAALDTFDVGTARTRYAPAFELAASVLATSDLPRREVVLVSDFQRAGWDGAAAVRLPAGTLFTPAPVGGEPASNLFVSGVAFRRGDFSNRERVSATARVVHRGGGEPVTDLPVTLDLDGRTVQSVEVDVPADGAVSVEFEPFTLGTPNTRATVRAGRDALPLDDAFHFVLSPGEAVSVLLAERPGAGPGPSLYLRRALAIGDAPAFRVDAVRADRLDAAVLDGRDLVVLVNAPFPGGAAGRALRGWIERGGGLLAVVGGAGGRPGELEDVMPGSVGGLVDRTDVQGGTLGELDYDHPIFEIFRAPGSGDFTGARFFRYRRVSWPAREGVLARFDDGGVALAEAAVGRGRVVVWSSTLDASWNDLALQPVFLPFVHRLARHAAAYGEARAWSTVGELLDLRALAPGGPAGDDDRVGAGTDGGPAATASGGPVLVAPSGARVPVGPGTGLVPLEEQGFYEVRDPRDPAARPWTVAVNLDVAESDLTPIDPAELESAVVPAGVADGAASGDASPATAAATPETTTPTMSDAEDRRRRQIVWWYVLAAAAILLAGETALSTRSSRASRRDRYSEAS